jgi:hypothetical protein
MSLLDDARAIDRGRPQRCSVCIFIEDQPPARRAEFDELLAGRVGHTAAFKIMRREGYAFATPGAVANHRGAEHRA